MFQEVKELLTYIDGDDYDAKIIAEIKACALDLTRTAAIVLPGIIDITRTKNLLKDEWTITDNSTITDELIIKIMAVWCDKEIGNPPNKDYLEKAYSSLKGSLQLSRHYTDYEGVTTA